MSHLQKSCLPHVYNNGSKPVGHSPLVATARTAGRPRLGISILNNTESTVETGKSVMDLGHRPLSSLKMGHVAKKVKEHCFLIF